MPSPLRRANRARSSPIAHLRNNGFRHSYQGHQDAAVHSSFHEDLSRLLLDEDRLFVEKLDEQTREQQKRHVEALEEALAKHEGVRKSAEELYEQIKYEQEAERLRRARIEAEAKEAARRKALEEQRKKEEVEHQALLTRQREEEAERVAAQKRREETEKAQRKAVEEQQEAEKKAQQQAADAKAERQKHAQAQAQAQAQATASAPQPPAQGPNGVTAAPPSSNGAGPTAPSAATAKVVSSIQARQEQHDAYVGVHKRLKQLRADVSAAMKKDPQLKNLSDARREIVKRMGQVNRGDKAANREVIRAIQAQLDKADTLQNYTQDVSQYLATPPLQPVQGNAVLIFLLNHMVKSLFKSLEANVETLPPNEMGTGADPFGVVIATIFAKPEYKPGGHSLIDILWAKFHKRVPLLFGVRGRQPLPIACHAAGFAAITLRDFRQSKTHMVNPAPIRLFWEAIARLVNTPVKQQNVVHYMLLNNLLNTASIPRFIQFYGQAAIVALKRALIDFPKTAPQNEDTQREIKATRALVASLDRDMYLKL